MTFNVTLKLIIFQFLLYHNNWSLNTVKKRLHYKL